MLSISCSFRQREREGKKREKQNRVAALRGHTHAVYVGTRTTEMTNLRGKNIV